MALESGASPTAGNTEYSEKTSAGVIEPFPSAFASVKPLIAV
jgi:hypothetical protein